MNRKLFFTTIIALLAVFISAATALAQGGTAFTYQGQLLDGGSPANGSYDFRFRLYNAVSGGGQVGSTLTLQDLVVSEGVFITQLDFGSVFDGAALWLDIGVRPGARHGQFYQPQSTPIPHRHTLCPAQPIDRGAARQCRERCCARLGPGTQVEWQPAVACH